MKTLSKEAEHRIMQALERTADLVDAGESPTDAVVKIAGEYRLPPGHVRLMVTAYNTGRTTRQRETHDDVWEKAADFDLADPVAALEALYPGTHKTAACLHHEHDVSEDYITSPANLLAKRASAELLAEAAQIDWTMPGVQPPPDGDPGDRAKRAYFSVLSRQRDMEELRRQTSATMDKLARQYDGLLEYFNQPTSPSFNDVLPNLEPLFGKAGMLLADRLMESDPYLVKQAATRRPHSTRDGPYPLIQTLLNTASEVVEKTAAYDKEMARAVQESEDTLRPFAGGVSPSILEDAPSYKRADATTGFSSGISRGLFSGLTNSFAPKSQNQLVDKNLLALTDPTHESELRGIRTQAVLSDLMQNDSHISGYDPEEVLNAFNDVTEAAPRAADQRMLLQTLLRRRLSQGSLDPFEVDQLLGMEQKLQHRDQGNTQGGGGGHQLSDSILS